MYRVLGAGFALFYAAGIYTMINAMRAGIPYVYPSWQGLIYRGRELPQGPTKWRIVASVLALAGCIIWVSGYGSHNLWFGLLAAGAGLGLTVDFVNWRKVGSDVPPPIPPARSV